MSSSARSRKIKLSSNSQPKTPERPSKAKACRGGGALRNNAMAQGFDAWDAASLRQEESDIAGLLGDGSAPPSFADSEAWWGMVLTIDPAFLSPQARSDCQMVVGFPPKGQAAPDWAAIHERARAIYNQKARAARLDSKLYEADPGPIATFCSGRGCAFFPCFSMPATFVAHGQQLSKIFDHRRARRREASAPPEAWDRAHGDLSASLWRGGLSGRALPAEGSWTRSLRALMQAMEEAGAGHVQVYPSFFTMFPRSMDHFEEMELLDRGRADPLRSSWELAAASQTPSGKAAQRHL